MITLERHKRNEDENKRGFVAIGCAALMALALILGTSALAKAGSGTAETTSEASWVSVNGTETTSVSSSFRPDMTTETSVGHDANALLDANLLDDDLLDGSVIDARVTPPSPILELGR